MSPAAVQQETQVLDPDSLHSDFPAGETLPLDYGETQPLDESCVGFHDWGKTQVVDYSAETVVVQDNDDEGGMSERTALLNDEGLVDDHGFGAESVARNKDGNLMDPDASTDEEDDRCRSCAGDVSSSMQLTGASLNSDNEYSRKNFTSVRVAAMRSFGFAASHSMAHMPTTSKSGSSNCNKDNYNSQFNAEDLQTREECSLKETSILDPNLVGSKKDGISVEHDAQKTFNSFECGDDEPKTRVTSTTVKRLFGDNFPYQGEETATRSKSSNEELLPPPFLCSPASAGLSYILSQEPGIQSQVNALDVVDKFLSINDVGLSQDNKNENNDLVKSPPTANVKRTKCFARKSDRSPVGNLQAYDWVDSLEDEAGGELFRRRKDLFFVRKGMKFKSRSLPPKVKSVDSEMAMDDVNRSTDKGSQLKVRQKPACLSYTDSCLKHKNSERSVPAYETRLKKKLFEDINKQTNMDMVGQLEQLDIDKTKDDVYDVGPDTQIAAEAIEALGHGSLVNFEQIHVQSTKEDVAGTIKKVDKSKGTYSIDFPEHKRNFITPYTEGKITPSKQKKNKYTKSSKERYGSSRKCSRKSRAKVNLEEATKEIILKKTNQKLEEDTKRTNEGESVASVVRDTLPNIVHGTFIEEVEMPSIPMKTLKQNSVSRKCDLGVSPVFTSPVAHRTRSSKENKLFKLQENLSKDTCRGKSKIDKRTYGTIERKNEVVSKAPVVLMFDEHNCAVGLNKRTTINNGFSGHADECDMESVQVHVEETGSMHAKYAYREPKRRKMDYANSKNEMFACNINNHSEHLAVNTSKVVKPSTQKRKGRLFIRSIAEILDTVKRKKRSESSSIAFETDYFPSNIRKTQVSGSRTRSSMLSNLLNNYFSSNSHFNAQEISYKPACDGTSNTCSGSAVKEIIHHETSVDGSDSRLLDEVVGNATSEESPIENAQLVLIGSPTKAMEEVSPICIAQECSRKSFHKSLSRSKSRELNRLKITEISPKGMLQDLRRRKDMPSFKVCFSHHLGVDLIKQQQKILSRLGIRDVSSSSEATHFVADKFVRTKNMLEAIAMGKPVVTPMWLESCGQACCYIDEKNYILRDDKKEKEMGFNMPISLTRACQHPLLQGKRVFITPNTKPSQELISCLVKAAHGQPLKRIGKSILKEENLPDNLFILSCEDDFAQCIPLMEKGAEIFSSELLLNGIVIQKLEYERHRLFLDQIKKTRSTLWLRRRDGKGFLPVNKCT